MLVFSKEPSTGDARWDAIQEELFVFQDREAGKVNRYYHRWDNTIS